MTKPKGIQAKSADTLIIENRLRKTQEGEIVTYDELTKLLGRNVVMFCRGNVGTARHALIEESIFFDCIPNEGYKRLTLSEATASSEDFRRRARKTIRRGIRHLRHIPLDQLSDEDKMKHMSSAVQFETMELFSSTKAANRIETAVKDSSHKMAIGETLKLFGG